MDINHLLGYLGAVATGLVLGLLGGGGALMSIPVLVYLFHIPASVASGYSLFLVGVTALSGAVQKVRHKSVDFQAALWYGLPSMATVYLMRRFLMPSLPNTLGTIGSFTLSKDHLVLFILSIVMAGAGYKMLSSEEPMHDTSNKKSIDYFKLVFYAILIGAFVGLVGAGGGFLMIPALIYFAHLSMFRAVGTSLVLVSANSFVGFLGDVGSNPHIDWQFLFFFSAFSIAGVLVGTYAHHYIHGNTLRRGFGWFMVIVAVSILVRELTR
jgi:uncharacterized membrane protein YfcA